MKMTTLFRIALLLVIMQNYDSRASEAKELQLLYNKVASINNIWDADREGMYVNIVFANRELLSDPPLTIDMLPTAAPFELRLDGKRYKEWAKRMLSTLVAEKWKKGDPADLFLCRVTIETPGNGVLLKISIAKDMSAWCVDGSWISSTPEMKHWVEGEVIIMYNLLDRQLREESEKGAGRKFVP